jgi:hypothetical protein
MSVSFSASAVIGVRVAKEKLFTRVRVPGCSHANAEGVKFCPECGKPAWRDRSEEITGYDSDRETLRALSAGLADLSVEIEHCEDNTHFIIGHCCVSRNDRDGPGMFKLTGAEFEAIRERIKAALEARGLWDEEAFGLWVIPYASY